MAHVYRPFPVKFRYFHHGLLGETVKTLEKRVKTGTQYRSKEIFRCKIRKLSLC